MTAPILTVIDKLVSDLNERHAWLGPASEQIRQWRAEDEANGIFWETSRERGDSNVPASNK